MGHPAELFCLRNIAGAAKVRGLAAGFRVVHCSHEHHYSVAEARGVLYSTGIPLCTHIYAYNISVLPKRE